jgi:hypothetical protein
VIDGVGGDFCGVDDDVADEPKSANSCRATQDAVDGRSATKAEARKTFG